MRKRIFRKWRGSTSQFPVVIAAGVHLFPFRTEQLSPPAPMVLGGQPPGRVGRRRIILRRAARAARFSLWALRKTRAMRWVDVEAQQPRLAELGRQKLAGPGVVLIGTVRKDGTARISAVEPFFW